MYDPVAVILWQKLGKSVICEVTSKTALMEEVGTSMKAEALELFVFEADYSDESTKALLQQSLWVRMNSYWNHSVQAAEQHCE